MSLSRSRLLIAGLALSLALPAAGPALADPPDWAPAHGWRAKHEHKHRDEGRVIYVPMPAYAAAPMPAMPYGIDRGTCDRGLLSNETIGNVLGGVAGGALGTQVGKGKGNTAAIIGGTIIGVIAGGAVGQSFDRVDAACMAQTLEYAPDRRRVAWTNDQSGLDFGVTPVRSWQQSGAYCREYQTNAVIGGRRQQAYGTACRMPDGAWRIVE